MMRNIYLHGALNLAASAASSDHDGLSFPRDPNRTRHIRVGVTWTQPDLVSRKASWEYHIFNGDIWDREVEAAPLNTHGWVLQERALAPRILHLGKSQLYWQCNAIFHSEMFPSDLKVKNLGPHVPRSELVNAYSATALTRAEDKLIAVQALAETMLDATGDTYVAGLWKSRIVEDVLWTTDVDDLPKGVAVRRPREWRAPTWSWASLDCKAEARSVYHYTGPLELSGKSFVSEMAPSVEGFAGVSTGQLRSASLQVRGLLYRNRFAFTMKTLESPLSLYRPADESTPWSFKIVLDEWDEEAVRGPEYSVPAGALFFTVGSPIAGTIEGLVLESVAERGYQFRRTAYFEADISYVSTEKILKGSAKRW
ncbi:heterokaryon incompatibility protein [Botryosphaeria dothidea]|uniref:Heterokaryon incompatibility protein n=1 Tax=Botryosphaeria dothidea TaxID=55169 RepID=A0A8H4ISD6_9PEZI|nr:heterokaryon incompatibility protein [Botryosphaeria dothidea]